MAYNFNSGKHATEEEKTMGRGAVWMRRHADEMGLPKRQKMRHWTPEEVELLKSMWLDGKDFPEISAVLKRTEAAVKEKAYSCGMSKGKRKKLGTVRIVEPPAPLLFSSVTLVRSVATGETFSVPIKIAS
jgi:hypothetical protein